MSSPSSLNITLTRSDDSVKGLDPAVIRAVEAALMARGGKQRGGHIYVNCVYPNHADDTDGHMSYNPEINTFFCHKCDVGGGLYKLAGLLGVTISRSGSDARAPKIYYTAYANDVRKVRQPIIDKDGNPDKIMWWDHLDKGRWEKGRDGRDPGMYHQAEAFGGDPDEWIHVFNGEKAADRAILEGIPRSSCFPDGEGKGGKFNLAYLDLFKGRKVAWHQDNDATGVAFAEEMKNHLPGVAEAVKVIEWGGFGVPKGGDAYDAFELDLTAEQLQKIVDGTPAVSRPVAPAAPGPADGKLSRDYGHAAVLAPLFRDRYRWAVHRGSWMQYVGKVWRAVPEEAVAKEAADALRKEYVARLARATGEAFEDLSKRVAETCVFARVISALAFLRGWPGILTANDERDRPPWDADPWLLNLRNGTLDLHSLELRPHDPSDLITQLAPVDYDPTARSDHWDDHLRLFLPDPDVRRQVQRDLGRSLAGAHLEEVLPIWFGAGANGKSTTLRVFHRLLGHYAQIAPPRLLIASKYERHPTELAGLCGSRLVFSAEIGGSARLDEERAKSLSGGEAIRAHFMGHDDFEFPQTWTITLICNHKPTIADTSGGMWRRVRLIPWTVTLPTERQRPQEDVVSELIADGPAVLAWMVAGLRDWQADHHWVADAVRVATDTYRQEQDVLSGFLSECCVLKPRCTVTKAALFASYQEWCGGAGEEPLAQRAFTQRLRDRGIGEKNGTGHVRLYAGIGIGADRGTDSNTSRESEITKLDLESLPLSAPIGENDAPVAPVNMVGCGNVHQRTQRSHDPAAGTEGELWEGDIPRGR